MSGDILKIWMCVSLTIVTQVLHHGNADITLADLNPSEPVLLPHLRIILLSCLCCLSLDHTLQSRGLLLRHLPNPSGDARPTVDHLPHTSSSFV